MTKIKQIKQYTDAATLDILELLQQESTGIFQFRRISKIALIMVDLVDSVATPHAHGAHSHAMRSTEDVSPMLHSTLAGVAFDGDELLRKKYEELQAHHNQLKQRSLDIEEAHGLLRVAHGEMKHHKLLLDEQTQHIERERERLQLKARNQGERVELPPMPSLAASIGEEVEDVAEDVAGVVDTVKSSVGEMLRNVAGTIDPDGDDDDPEDNEDVASADDIHAAAEARSRDVGYTGQDE